MLQAAIVIIVLMLGTVVDLTLWWSSDRGLLEYCPSWGCGSQTALNVFIYLLFSSGKSGGLSGGAVAAIVIVVLLVGTVAALMVLQLRY